MAERNETVSRTRPSAREQQLFSGDEHLIEAICGG